MAKVVKVTLKQIRKYIIDGEPSDKEAIAMVKARILEGDAPIGLVEETTDLDNPKFEVTQAEED